MTQYQQEVLKLRIVFSDLGLRGQGKEEGRTLVSISYYPREYWVADGMAETHRCLLIDTYNHS